MCRDKHHGGRRCPHDNSTARRMRRLVHRVRDENSEFLARHPEYQGYVTDTALPTMDDIRHLTQSTSLDSNYESIMSLGLMIDSYVDEEHTPLEWLTELNELKEECVTLQSTLGEAYRQRASSAYIKDPQESFILFTDSQNTINSITPDLRSLENRIRDKEQQLSSHYAQQYQNVLERLGSLGGAITNTPTTGNNRNAIHTLHRSLVHLPSSWVEASNSHGDTLRIIHHENATGAYSPEFHIGENGDTVEGSAITIEQINVRQAQSHALHEFTHRIQHVLPQVQILEDQHREKRLSEPVDSYMWNHTGTMGEVLPCAVSALYTGTHGSLRGYGNYVDDPETRHFALGVLAASVTSSTPR